MALDCLQGRPRVLYATCGNVIETPACFVDQQKMNALTLQLVVVVQPFRVDQRNIAFAIFGNHFFDTGLYLLGQFRKRRAGLRERNDITLRERHESLLT